MLIKIEAEINVDDFVCDFKDKSELDWFKEMMEDRANTMLILHSNDVGDTIGWIPQTVDQAKALLEALEQAKAMEKEQIIDALQEFLDITLPNEVCEQYYNETFKSE